MKRKKSYEKWWPYSITGTFMRVYGSIAAIALIIGLISTIGDDFMIIVYLLGFLYLVIWGAVKLIRWILGRKGEERAGRRFEGHCLP